MMKIGEVKAYLRVDEDDHSEDTLIKTIMSAAVSFIEAAVGDFDETDERAVMLFFAVCQDYYDNRTLMQMTSGNTYMRHMYSSIIAQLQVEQLTGGDFYAS